MVLHSILLMPKTLIKQQKKHGQITRQELCFRQVKKYLSRRMSLIRLKIIRFNHFNGTPRHHQRRDYSSGDTLKTNIFYITLAFSIQFNLVQLSSAQLSAQSISHIDRFLLCRLILLGCSQSFLLSNCRFSGYTQHIRLVHWHFYQQHVQFAKLNITFSCLWNLMKSVRGDQITS